MFALTIRGRLMRACEQLNELFLRKVCLRAGGLQNFLKGFLRVVEQLGVLGDDPDLLS